MNKLSGLQYYGGKSALSSTGTGQWINSLLHQDTNVLYCEPFAGMLGVLLQRQPAKKEVVNDKSEHIINWWRVVRDMPTEFERLIQNTPYSRTEWKWARENLDNTDQLYRALAFHIVCNQSTIISTEMGRTWSTHRSPNAGKIPLWSPCWVEAISARLRNVQLECCDAIELLDKTAKYENAIIYCDPPYAMADTSPYAENVDKEALKCALLQQQGLVAISGYGDEWDSLDWHRSEHQTFVMQIGQLSDRVDVLWTNYKPQIQINMKLF